MELLRPALYEVSDAKEREIQGEQMLRTFEIERLSLVSKKPFSEILAAIEAGVAHPDVSDFLRSVEKTHSADEMEQMINSAMKPKSLMLFMKFDQGEVLSKQADSIMERVIRLLMGNPLIMAEMTRRSPDAGSYAPVAVLLMNGPMERICHTKRWQACCGLTVMQKSQRSLKT